MYRTVFVAILLCSLAVAQNNRTARVLNGRGAGQGEVPYMVSLRAFGSTFHFCGASLISNRWVVTAASCVFGRARNSLHMVAGTVSLSAGGVSRRSSNIVIHFGFDGNTIDNNIALVQSGLAFPLSQNIWPIPISSAVYRGVIPVVLSGFGSTRVDGGPNSDRLQVANLVTASDEDCDEHFGGGINTDFNICTDNFAGEGFCTTDLGGPLAYNGQLIGIASWNFPCGAGVMDLYTRISFYRVWIGSIAGV